MISLSSNQFFVFQFKLSIVSGDIWLEILLLMCLGVPSESLLAEHSILHVFWAIADTFVPLYHLFCLLWWNNFSIAWSICLGLPKAVEHATEVVYQARSLRKCSVWIENIRISFRLLLQTNTVSLCLSLLKLPLVPLYLSLGELRVV